MSIKQKRILAFSLLTVLVICASPWHVSAQVDPATAARVQEDLQASWYELLPVYPNAGNQAPDPLTQNMHQFLHSAVAVASDGSFCTLSTFQMGAGRQSQPQAIVVKYSADGERLWNRVYGERGGAFGTGIVIDDNGNVYISGMIQLAGGRESRRHGFAASITPDGRERWVYLEHEQHGVTEARSMHFNLAVTRNAVLLVGTGSGMVAPGAERDTLSSIMVTRLNTGNGRRVWTRLIEPDNASESFDSAPGVAVTPQGLICVTANKLLAPITRVRPHSSQDAYVVMLNANGEVVRATQVGESHLPQNIDANDITSVVSAITPDAQGNLYIVGAVSNRNHRPAPQRRGQPAPAQDDYGMFITKLSPTGESQWIHVFGQQTAQFDDIFNPGRVQIDPNGQILVHGTLGGLTGRPMILRLDNRGQITSAQAFSQSGTYSTSSFALTSDGRSALIHGIIPAAPSYFFTARLDLEP